MIHLKKTRLFLFLVLVLFLVTGSIVFNLTVYIENQNNVPAKYAGQFRNALAVSPFSGGAFDKDGYIYTAGEFKASSREQLEKLFIEAGATEMYARIGTKRQVTDSNLVDGKEDSNANIHTLEQGLELARLAAKLDIPLNPEIMCAYTYMDMDQQQAPDFKEYPEIYALQNGKSWQELTLDEMAVVLEAYGKFVAEEILNTGVQVENWNIGNEANFGFAGVNIGLKTAINPKLEGVSNSVKNVLPILGTSWLKDNVWKYNAVQMGAVAKGIKSAYKELGIDAGNVKFSTHIATVITTVNNAVTYFNTLKDNGFPLDVAGISFYPSAPGVYMNKMTMYKKIVTAINTKCDLPVFIAEFAYPSGPVSGPYAGWSKTVSGYPHTPKGQADMYQDVVAWGKTHGLIGIRYWAPDYSEWGSMSMFDYEESGAKAKEILLQQLEENHSSAQTTP
jgi:arabinogalactan endo-1,4-beta-galactosidase